MTLKEIIIHPEGRRLEFKETLPEHADLANTMIAFANDTGGELYIGIPCRNINKGACPLAELKKQKITLSLKQQDEWEEYFNEYKNECCTFVRQIRATDAETVGEIRKIDEFRKKSK